MAAAKTFSIEIVTPERKVFGGDVDFAVFPGAEGELGVMAGHAATLAVLVPGEIKVVKGQQTDYFATVGGFVEILRNKVTVAVESAERPADLDRNAVQQEHDAAVTAFSTASDVRAKGVAELRIKRSAARLRVLQHSAGSVATSTSDHGV
jgi:F-type H+-transporting ATPase subunit epsilon